MVKDGDQQMVAILTAVLTDGLPTVEAACAEALDEGIHSADVILNILARRAQPEPLGPIATPSSLVLKLLPCGLRPLRRSATAAGASPQACDDGDFAWSGLRSWR